MRSWDLTTVDAPGGMVSPVVLATEDGARAITLRLQAGQELREHQVRERAWVCVVEGDAEITCAGGHVAGGAGTFVTFDPAERHSIVSPTGARLLLVLAPWPGEGHFGDSD